MVTLFLAAVLVASPSPSPSPSPSLAPTAAPAATPKPRPLFTAPKGWVRLSPGRKQNGFTEVASYVFDAGGYTQGFDLIEGPSGGVGLTMMTTLNLQDLAKTQKGFHLIAQQDVALCSGQRGRLVKYRATEYRKMLMFEQLFAVSGTTTYVASYSRAATQKEVPAAVAALRSVCPPVLPAVAADTSPVPFTPPAGWQRLNPSAIPGVASAGIIAFWVHPSGAAVADSINLVKVDSRIGPLTSAQQGEVLAAGIKQKFPGSTMRQNHAETLCNGTTPGRYLEYRAKLPGGDFIIEQSVIFAENVQYVATYGRIFTQPEDAAARRSLDTLCAAGAEITS